MKKEIALLQKKMKEKGYDAYLIETADAHQSEYVGQHDKVRVKFSGFTGSAGTLLVLGDEAHLWTDGRYFIQAAIELEGSGIILERMGQKGVLTLEEFLASKLKGEAKLALDLKTVSYAWFKETKERLGNITFIHDEDIINEIWQDRPAISCEKAYSYDVKYCGMDRKDKLSIIKKEMADKHVSGALFSALDDVCYLLNLRGNDVAFNPVVLGFVLIDSTYTTLYIQMASVDEKLKEELLKDGISLRPYASIYDDIELYDEPNIWFDPKKTNALLGSRLMTSVGHYQKPMPTQLMKAIKNEVETKNTKLAHIYDGVAVTKWMKWLKKEIQIRNISELEIQDKLESFRKEWPSFIEPSFETICGYNANAAMMHYEATKDNYAIAKNEGLVLVDSGGQYLEGTTDITRTIVLGNMPDTFKEHYTLALKGFLKLQEATFLKGCTGLNLDILARGSLWNRAIDYQCGTGHGVGHLLNVHEGPQGFRWRVLANRNENAVLEEGMITTDEPGVYIPNSHGVRHENELLCVKYKENEYGTFLKFEPITYAPIDLDGIDPSLLTFEEIDALNRYHELVYDTLEGYVDQDTKAFLKDVCRKVEA